MARYIVRVRLDQHCSNPTELRNLEDAKFTSPTTHVKNPSSKWPVGRSTATQRLSLRSTSNTYTNACARIFFFIIYINSMHVPMFLCMLWSFLFSFCSQTNAHTPLLFASFFFYIMVVQCTMRRMFSHILLCCQKYMYGDWNFSLMP